MPISSTPTTSKSNTPSSSSTSITFTTSFREDQINRLITNLHTSVLFASLVTITILKSNRLVWTLNFILFLLHTCIAYNSIAIKDYKIAKFHTMMILLSMFCSILFSINFDWNEDLVIASGVFSWLGTSLFLLPFVNVCTVNY